LAAFDANFFEDYAATLRGSLQRVRLVVEPEHAALVRWIVPPEALVSSLQFASAQ